MIAPAMIIEAGINNRSSDLLTIKTNQKVAPIMKTVQTFFPCIVMLYNRILAKLLQLTSINLVNLNQRKFHPTRPINEGLDCQLHKYLFTKMLGSEMACCRK